MRKGALSKVEPLENDLTAPLHREHEVLVFDTHPIQYRTPVFRRLSQLVTGFKVFYFDSSFDGSKWWFREIGKIPKQEFGVPMREGFRSEVLGVRQLGLWGFYKAAKEILETYRPESIIIFGYYLVENWILWWLVRGSKTKLLYIGELFDMGKPGIRRSLKEYVLRLFFRGVDGVLCTGHKARACYQKVGVPATRIEYSRYCVDNDFFQMPVAKAKAVRAKLRKQLGIPARALVVLFVGRLFDRKRPLDVIELQRKCAGLGVHTVLVGNGELEEQVRSQAAGVAGLHLVGFKDQHELKELYRAADILFVPSTMETWGLVVNEACASGMTAIATDSCGVVGDLIIPGETGFAIPTGDVESAYRAVAACVKKPRLLSSLRKRAYERALKEYSVEQFAQGVVRASRKAKP